MSLTTTSAILLRSYPFSETSQILRFYAEDLGSVSAVARGSRKYGGRRGAPLSTFSEGALTLYLRESRELQTYKAFEPSIHRWGLSLHPLRLSAASVLGEIVLQHAESDPHPALYARLAGGLDAVEACGLEHIVPELLIRLWGIIRELGYTPLLAECVVCGRPISGDEMARFDFAAGGLRCSTCLEEGSGPRLGPKARVQLRALLKGRMEGEILRPRAQLRLVSDFIAYHISGGTPLRSMDVLSTLLGKGRA